MYYDCVARSKKNSTWKRTNPKYERFEVPVVDAAENQENQKNQKDLKNGGWSLEQTCDCTSVLNVLACSFDFPDACGCFGGRQRNHNAVCQQRKCNSNIVNGITTDDSASNGAERCSRPHPLQAYPRIPAAPARTKSANRRMRGWEAGILDAFQEGSSGPLEVDTEANKTVSGASYTGTDALQKAIDAALAHAQTDARNPVRTHP